jgi:hypothetical protein
MLPLSHFLVSAVVSLARGKILPPSRVRFAPVAAVQAASTEDTTAARMALFAAIAEFRAVEQAEGKTSIDFGVKGGELDKKSRAPADLRNVWRGRVRVAATTVEDAIKALALRNPTADATKLLGTVEGALCPLHGAWRNVWTTAADASFSPNSTRGDAAVYNVVDGLSGQVTNHIDFLSGAQFRVVLRATALSPQRVGLRFRFVKVSPPKPILGLIRTIVLPVPGPFITRVLSLLGRGPKEGPPPAYFDVIYLDDELRVHVTGQGNLFVQQRAPWR